MKDEHIRVIIEAEVNDVFEAETKTNDNLYAYGAAAVVLGSIAIYGASSLIRGNKGEIVADGPVLIPVDNTGEVKGSLDVAEEEKTFSVVSGSQFSRQLMFVCDKGCMKEFEVDEDDEEVMCPYCGTLGDSPL
jgi:hypothetical protein